MSRLSLAAAARYLHIDSQKLKRMAEAGEVPARKIERGDSYGWEFFTGALDAWEDETGRITARGGLA